MPVAAAIVKLAESDSDGCEASLRQLLSCEGEIALVAWLPSTLTTCIKLSSMSKARNVGFCDRLQYCSAEEQLRQRQQDTMEEQALLRYSVTPQHVNHKACKDELERDTHLALQCLQISRHIWNEPLIAIFCSNHILLIFRGRQVQAKFWTSHCRKYKPLGR